MSLEKNESTLAIPVKRLERNILLIRGQRVMLDQDIAEIYGVTTKRLNEQVRRNKNRFPEDFMFQLTRQEFAILRSQFATSRWGGRRYPPHAFTEHGAVMLASHKELARKLTELENRYDKQFQVVFDAIRQLMEPPKKTNSRIGF